MICTAVVLKVIKQKTQRVEKTGYATKDTLSHINPLTQELNPSAQRCLTRYFTGDIVLEPCISLIYA
jgi:hypothetical protein